ncbi:hypothetical protein HPP92_027175 [Vanilla planifolia]|uniref:DUF7963 domain-containing protein n=1 Tax=Vanilla planifolia TaxID=51239 RepID=A0A835PC98_VANPL|nr:hypothetical protein HPP92_027175 [Vanilla planifolia]
MTAASAAGAGEAAAKEVSRRFEALLSVRSKAMKGKGAWYWAHLEPLLLQGQEPGLAMAVKASLLLCDAVFSASILLARLPSEHLKRGACPSFNSAAAAVAAAVAAAGPTSARNPSHPPPFRKRPALPSASTDGEPSSPSCLALVAPYATATCPPYSSSPFPPPPPLPLALPAPHNRLVLSGGKEDLGALAMLEDSVKRLKNPKATPCPALPKPQADAAISFFADWLLESGGGASLPHSITQNSSFPSPSGFTSLSLGLSWAPPGFPIPPRLRGVRLPRGRRPFLPARLCRMELRPWPDFFGRESPQRLQRLPPRDSHSLARHLRLRRRRTPGRNRHRLIWQRHSQVRRHRR